MTKERALQKACGILPEVEKKGWPLSDDVIQSSSFVRMRGTVASVLTRRTVKQQLEEHTH
jgi:hypothetical protein